MNEIQSNKNIPLVILKYIASLSFAGLIIYLLFRNQDPVALVEKISEVEFGWVILYDFWRLGLCKQRNQVDSFN